jgi:uncharacterized cupin superfamily protein
MSKQAYLDKTDAGWVATSGGWFVLHASQAPWFESDRFGVVCDFEGDAPFGQIGVNIHIVYPGQPSCLYHRENAQENFYVLTGTCTLVIEGEERQLKAGHFVHCPPWTDHVFVGAGEEPCAILMIGHRPTDHMLVYPVSPEAAKYNASVEEETTSVSEAYGEAPVFGRPGRPVWPL